MFPSTLLKTSILLLGLLPQGILSAPVTDKTELLISKVKARLGEAELLR